VDFAEALIMEKPVDSRVSFPPEPAISNAGVRKAAVLLASLPREDAAYLLRQLDEPQLIAVAQAAVTAPFRGDEQVAVLRELSGVRNLVPERDRDICDSTTRKCRQAFARITEASAATVVRLLADELPQTVAVVLAHIDPAVAAQVLERLPTDKQLAVTLRIADLQTPDPVALADVVRVLSDRFEELNRPPSSPIGGATHVAQILQYTKSATEKALLANVGQENGDLVRAVSRQLAVLRHLRASDARSPSATIHSHAFSGGESLENRAFGQP
jgi:flagellar motor switch protein FliG